MVTPDPKMYVSLTDKCFSVRTGMLQNDNMKKVPGAKYRSKTKTWEIPLSYPAWVHYWGMFSGRIVKDAEVDKWILAQHEREVALWNLRRAEPRSGFGLRPQQRLAVDWVTKAERACIGDDPGSGKTVMACALMDEHHHEHLMGPEGTNPFRALVVCPKSVFGVWKEHVLEWTGLNPVVAEDTAGKRRKAIDEWLQDGGVLIMNYQSVWRHTRLAPYGSIALKKCAEHGGKGAKEVKPQDCHVHLKELDQIANVGGFQYFILDEAHRISEPSNNQTRGLKWLARYCDKRLALTGTPVGKRPDDLWSVFNWLDPVGWPSRGQYVDRYCTVEMNYKTQTHFVTGLKPENRDEFYRMRDLYLLRRDFAEVTGRDIEKVYQTISCSMTPRHRKQYKDIRDKVVVEVPSGQLVVDSHLVKSTRLLQCSSAMLDIDPDNPIVTDEGEERPRVVMQDKSPKVDLLYDWWKNDIDGEPLVVMAGGPGSRQLIDIAIAKFVDKDVPIARVVGGMTAEEREHEVERYMKGAAQVIFGQTQSAGEGLNLDRGNKLAFLQIPWSLKEIIQAENRVRRASQDSDTVVITTISTEDSFDQRVAQLYAENKDMFDLVLGDPDKAKELF